VLGRKGKGGINFCVDLSATPYFLGRVGQQTNRPFPWVVSDFSLMDAIESGLVKIPQLAIRDTTGAEIPGYFNIWRWILQPGRLTPAERGGKHAAPKPEAVLKWAHTPIGMLAGLWEAEREQWLKNGEPRPPVFILVCKNTALANVVYEWLANDQCPSGIPPTVRNPRTPAGCGLPWIPWAKRTGRRTHKTARSTRMALRNLPPSVKAPCTRQGGTCAAL
jgi:hypothetical protein